MLPSFFAGLGLGLSLIIAIGAQNLFVLRQGVRREHVVLVATICAVSDAVLIVLGVSGVGLVLHAVPWLVDAVRWAGAVFLVCYGLLAARRAWRPSGAALRVGEAEAEASTPPAGGATGVAVRTRVLPVVLTCLALTWLNPHVYLDTVVLIGTVSTQFPGAGAAFAAGAVAGSFLFFFGLGYGAAWLRPVFARPASWRLLEGGIAVVMATLALRLAFG